MSVHLLSLFYFSMFVLHLALFNMISVVQYCISNNIDVQVSYVLVIFYQLQCAAEIFPEINGSCLEYGRRASSDTSIFKYSMHLQFMTLC